MTWNLRHHITEFEAEGEVDGIYLFNSPQAQDIFGISFEISYVDTNKEIQTVQCTAYSDDKDYDQTCAWSDIEFLGMAYATNILSIKRSNKNGDVEKLYQKDEKYSFYVLDETLVSGVHNHLLDAPKPMI